VTLFADQCHFITDIIVSTYAEFGRFVFRVLPVYHGA